MKVYVAALSALFSMPFGTQAAAQTQWALLIGIDTYQPAGTQAQHPAGCTYGRCELGRFENLGGAVNDAQAMADLLTSPKFAFPAGQVVLLTNPAPARPLPGAIVLPAEQTDRDGILAAMRKYLVDTPQRGDTVVFYDASHGSLRVNSKGNKLTVLVNGQSVHADSTLVPADAYKGGYDVRDREMTRIFQAALDKGIHLTAIFDSCHSGGMSRGIGPAYRARSLAFDPRDIAEPPDALANGDPRPAPTQRADNPALVFSAAQQDQTAKEMPLAGATTEAHGAFTAALIDALEALPAATPASVLYQRVKAVLEGDGVPDQEPDLDATEARRQQPLFGGAAADPGKVRAAVLKTDEDGSAWLDIGRVSGIGVGSEFTSIAASGKGQIVKLRVANIEGIARSSATVISPPGAKVAPGEVFELTKWLPAESAPLKVWLWPSNLSESDILAAAAQIRAAGVSTVSDPAEESWTHILCWDGSDWTVQRTGAPAPVSLGAQLTAAVLKQHLPAGAKLWANLPPSRELAAKLTLGDRTSAVQAAPDLAGAHYALTGTLTADGPAYAWFHKLELAAGPRTPVSADHSPGCSATSQYPVRSDWVAIADASVVEEGGAALNKFALLLAKVHGWLELADSPADASTANYYTLALVRASGETPLAADQAARQGDLLKLALQSEDRVIEKRWVYVLDIDCHGKGTLLYPLDYAENQFPNAADTGRQFVLRGARTLRIGPPYGVDTLILLSTAQPLPDPYVLNFEGAASRGARGAESPLQKLLVGASAGTRGFTEEVPTNWGIGLTTLRSIPKDAAQ
ncbi:MAG: caspase family protein [Terracidiphilus sp.]